MPPKSTPRSSDPAAVNARLHTTLADLESERTALIAQFRALQQPTKLGTPAIATSSDGDITGPEKDEADEKTMQEAKAVVKRHIKLLHDYNAVRDVGQGLLGMIAEQRGSRIVDVMEERGVTSND